VLSAASTHTGACEWYALAASAMQQQHAAAADEHISCLARDDVGSGVHRGSLEDLELRMRLGRHLELQAALLKAIWWDLRLASLLMHLFCVYYGRPM